MDFKGKIGRAAAAALALFLPAAALGEAEVLWWRVGDPEDWAGESGNFASLDAIVVENRNGTSATASELGVTSARVRVVETGAYLQMPEFEYSDDYTSVRLSGWSDAADVPTIMYAALGEYGSAEYSFVIELGNWENGAWTFLADSEARSYTELTANANISVWGDESIRPSPATPWTPDSYTAPEPSSGLLAVVGAALLALRRGRKRRG